MKIHLLDLDPRINSDPSYLSNMGSFGIVVHGLNSGLKQLGYYSEPDDADWVGTIEGVGIGFKYKDKKSFIINVWDMINVLPNELLAAQKQSNQRMFGLSNQVTNLWRKYGVPCDTVMPGIDLDFYKKSREKTTDKLVFLFDSFANVRSGFDINMSAFFHAFAYLKQDGPKLIIKNTTNSERFLQIVRGYQDAGLDISLINERITFEQMRDLYSSSDISLNVMRHSSWGLNIQMAAACGCLPIVGDFCPSNEMDVGELLRPSKEVFIDEEIGRLIDIWGLHNAYGNFSYSERPRFYDYSLSEYVDILRDINDVWYRYDTKTSKVPINSRVPLLDEKWTWKFSAQTLVNFLEE